MRGFVSLQMWRKAVASLDFTSSLYLGIWHPHETLAPWAAVTLGKPAALEPVPGGAALAAGVARLQELEAGVVGPSTLHLFWDLFAMLAREGDISIHLDRGSTRSPVGVR